MYKKLRIVDIAKVEPEFLGYAVEHSLEIALRKKLEGRIDKKLGMIIAVIEVIEVGEGHIIAGDGAVYYETTFDAIVYKPELQEIVEGKVVEILDYGAFVEIGPLDGLLHVSQITSGYMYYDKKNSRLISKDGKRVIKVGDMVRARIVAVSLNEREPRASKIGLTMRQVALGKLEWLEEAREKLGELHW